MKRLILKNLGIRKLILLFSGLIATGIAITIFLAPEAFYAVYGIELAGNASLSNELKAPAGMLFVSGLVMLAGVFRSQLTVASLMTATAVYLSYGASRLVSIAVDGMPDSALVEAAIVELVIGSVCLLALLPALNRREAQTTH